MMTLSQRRGAAIVVMLAVTLAACGGTLPPVLPPTPLVPLPTSITMPTDIALPPGSVLPANTPGVTAAAVVTLPITTAIAATVAPTIPPTEVSSTAIASPTVLPLMPTSPAATIVPATTAMTVTPATTVSPMPMAVPTAVPTVQASPTTHATPTLPATPLPSATVTLLRGQTVTPTSTLAPANLTAAIEAARIRNLPGDSSVTLLVAGTETTAGANGRQPFYAASTIKLPIYLTLAHRIKTGEAEFTWDTPVTVHPEDIVGGTGVLQQRSGQTFSVREVATVMIGESDNVAANLLLGCLGGRCDTHAEHVRVGAMRVTQDMEGRVGVRGIVIQRGLQDPEAAMMHLNTVTTDALAQLMRRVAAEPPTLDGANDLLKLLKGRGMHNPWHPGDTVPCALGLSRIGGIYPADRNNAGVRLDLLLVPGMSEQGYILAVGTTTTPALEAGIETRIARFEGDVQQLLSGTWAQCVDTRTGQL